MKEITKIHGLVYPPDKLTLPLTQSQRALCAKIASNLTAAFCWHHTAEGCDFWVSVRNRLQALSKGEALA